LKPGQSTHDAWTKDGKWDKRRAAYHQSVVNSFLYDKKPPVGRKPIIWVLGGGTASGKSTASRIILGKDPNVVRVDPDDIKLTIPEFAGLKESDSLHATARVHEESSYESKMLLAQAGAKGLDIVYDSTTSGNTGPAMAKEFVQRGYDVRAMFVDAPIAAAFERANWREHNSSDPANFGRHVPEDVIRANHQGAAKNFMAMRDEPGLTSKQFWDTTERTPRLIYERQGNGEETIHDQARWQQYQDKAAGKSGLNASVRGPYRRSFSDTERRGRFEEALGRSSKETQGLAFYGY
jgi:predicted ABC-type ATPase